MATHANSTTAPARPLLPSRGPGGRFVKSETVSDLAAPEARPELPPEPLLAGVGVLSSERTPMGVLSSEETSGCLPKFGETPPAPATCGRMYTTEPDTLDAVRADLDALVALYVGAPRCGDIATPSATAATCGHMYTHEPDTAANARAIHLRRQLEAAAEHGVALFSALRLPQVVGPDFVRHDIVTVGDAVDLAIATLDAIDADPDLEDGADDEFTGDDELSLGWTAKVDQVHLGQDQDDHETTALERYGKGFFRSGPDDAEDGHDAERTHEDGSEDSPHPWRFERPDAAQRAAHLCEVARHG